MSGDISREHDESASQSHPQSHQADGFARFLATNTSISDPFSASSHVLTISG
jgi:hypothetical protein